MDIGTIIKYVLISALILAGYYVVSRAAALTRPRREGFSLGGSSSDSSSSPSSSSNDAPGVAAKNLSDTLTDKTKNIVNSLQLSDNSNRNSYEATLDVMDAWTQGKIIASLNSLSEQMISDSNTASPPSDKTISLMNAVITMTNFQTTAVPAAFKYLDASN
jgi:hypothetical protein